MEYKKSFFAQAEDMVYFLNERKIPKENIVSIYSLKSTHYLIYLEEKKSEK